MRRIDVRCRAIGIDLKTGGYRLLSNKETKEFIEAGWESAELSKPYNDKEFSVDYDKRYLIANLTDDTCWHFGMIGDVRMDLLLKIDDTTLISFEDKTILLQDVIDKFDLKSIKAYLLCVFGLGEIFRQNGFRFYIRSHEGNRHNEPHVHVKTKSGREGSVGITSLKLLAGNIKPRELKEIKKILEGRQGELLQAWNLKSDGMNVDIDEMLEPSKIA